MPTTDELYYIGGGANGMVFHSVGGLCAMAGEYVCCNDNSTGFTSVQLALFVSRW